MEKNWNQYWSNIMMKVCKNDKAMREYKYDLYYLGSHKNLTLKTIEEHINDPWYWNTISQNPNVTFEFIEKYIDKNWDWECLSRHPNITLEFVEKYIDKKWNWYTLSQNPNITIEMIIKHNHLPWKIYGGILNKNFNQEKEFFELRVKHQQFVQDNLLEEFVKAYMHPNRIKKLLDMGYSIDDLDNIL